MEFVCRLGGPDGRVFDKVHSARDERTLRKELEGRGYHVFEIRRRGALRRLPLGRLFERDKKVSAEALLLFNQELAALLRSGLPVLQALDMTAERQRDPAFREVLADVRDQVKTGADLSEAFASYGDLLPPLYAPTLRAGERTGELEQVVRRFIRYQSLLLDARKKIVSAIVYPLVLVGLSLLLMAVMTLYVVPKFTEFFDALGSELPLITKIVVGVSVGAREHWLVLLVSITAATVFFMNWRRTTLGALTLDRLKLRLPVVGPILLRMAISEFCRSLSTLLSGGIPVIMALENSVGAVGNAHVRQRLQPIIGEVRQGVTLFKALEETGISPDIAIDMIKVGEATGALDEMLANASDFLDQEVEVSMQRLLSLLEPVMLVLMGSIVSILLISIYLPLFSLLGQMQG